MWLKMELDGITVQMQIKNYIKVSDDDWDSTWCRTDFSFFSKPWLNYHKDNDEVFLAREIDELKSALEALLEDRLTEQTEFSCIEPDFCFTLNPKKDLRLDPRHTYIPQGYEIVDIDMEWRVSFWHDGLTADYLSVTLDRENIEYLLNYLKWITGESTSEDESISRMLQARIMY